ncbi:MAG: hypothetical protein WHT09_02445 [Thermogutta sp.]
MAFTARVSLKDVTLLALIVAFGLLLRAIHWSPSADGDAARYINHAYALAQGSIPEYFDGAIAVRIPYLAYLVLWGGIFGYTTPVLQSSGLLTYVLAALLLWIITRMLYDAQAAHIATIFFSTLPIHVLLSTHALTDDLGLVFALASVLMWIIACSRSDILGSTLLFAVSGLLAGVATGIRQPFFLLGIILPLGSYFSGVSLTRCALATCPFATSALCYFGVEAIAFWAWLGDPLFRVNHDVFQLVNDSAIVNLAPRSSMSLGEKVFGFRAYLPSLLPSGKFGFVPILMALALADRISQHDKRASIPIAFIVILTAYHFWGSTSLRAWSVPPVVSRYLIPSVTVGCILCGAAVASINQHYRFGMLTGLAGAACLLITNLWIIAYGSQPNCTTEFAQYLASIPKGQRSHFVIPESVKRCFLPKDYWSYVEGMQVVPDEQLAHIETMDLSEVRAIAVPNETFYTYSHIGVVDALERTSQYWKKEAIVGKKWPRYLLLTGKPSARVIGYVYYRRNSEDKPEQAAP